ncbi:MBL fold metallo-hydrolase [Pedobacter gandavensis]|uniref:MBL fold metallo-hydrolase n=1 Tax=Pedobacter gandavensis TaxID=2679963 RepID=A0ABR6EV53_9SPHI|nr:rhodanese-like domain-containing protein [Pedobacter gandavensis]MBB2149077.1 MBL fold metallo-hydrolase [Pedobacter gandavensis]
MIIEQFKDEFLSHYSYAIVSECEQKIVLIDPARNPEPYYEFAKKFDAQIIGVIETHPHADFVSSHLEIHESTGATIYAHSLTGAAYPVEHFDEGATLSFGKIKLTSIHTPGHSPDSISVLLEHDGKAKAVFTGDTLFIGDCGRPDLRESVGNLQAKREKLALQMYHSLRDKLMVLDDEVLVYPAHGSGTLCGKALSTANSSTIGAEKISNWSLQEMTESDFMKALIADQPFIPKYFGYDVDLNRKGAPHFKAQVNQVEVIKQPEFEALNTAVIVVDARPESDFKEGHFPGAVNIVYGKKFETWLGSIIRPGEHFYLTAANSDQLEELIHRAASIGYEPFILAAFVTHSGDVFMPVLPLECFIANPEEFTIIDVRNENEVKKKKIFSHSKNIPLGELRERIEEIPADKPIVVHCAGGSRSAAGSSIIAAEFGAITPVYDLGAVVKDFGNSED